MGNYKRNTIQDNVLNACIEQVEDESKSDLLSTYHTHKYMENEGFKISRQQVRTAFYSLTQKGLLKKFHNNIWKIPDEGRNISSGRDYLVHHIKNEMTDDERIIVAPKEVTATEIDDSLGRFEYEDICHSLLGELGKNVEVWERSKICLDQLEKKVSNLKRRDKDNINSYHNNAIDEVLELLKRRAKKYK